MADNEKQIPESESQPAVEIQPTAESQPATEPASAEAAPADEVARLKAELEDVKDRALRGWAELENFRKRTARQMEEERRYAALPLFRDLLPVLDNMKRAVDASAENHDLAGLLEGVKMVVQQFETVLARHHCTPIPALHQPFDPNVHDAILRQPSPDFPPNTVIQEVEQGFRLHDRVVRPSRVIVSAPAENPAAAPSENKPS